MKRDEWTFQFSTDQLHAAVAQKIEFHAGRQEFWQAAKEKAVAEAKETGITISESDAGASYSNVTRAMTPTVLVDQTFQRRIGEAHAKIIEHNAKVRDYEGWRQVFAANKGRTLDLTADDYLFFFGK